MISLQNLVMKVMAGGYAETGAEAKVCQDIILRAISESPLNRNVTIKGGVVMHSISGDMRRATQDMDFDFIKYSLSDEAVRAFIEKLNCIDGISIRIDGDIVSLSQHEYRGKRVNVIVEDEMGHRIKSKIDIGVHKELKIEQDDYCFDVCLDDRGASLLINSKEQIFAEKLRALLRFGPLTTRYKDIFDMCFLSDYVSIPRLQECIKVCVFDDEDMKECDMDAVIERVDRTFSDKLFRRNIERSVRSNWLGVSIPDGFVKIISFLRLI